MSAIRETERTRLRRLPERAQFDRTVINAILDQALICHLAVLDQGGPVVVPTLFGRDNDDLILHGSPASRALGAATGPADVCVNVTLLDGIVVARSGFHSSMNYRSVIIFGRAEAVRDLEEKRRLLGIIVDHVIPNRNATARPMTDKEIKSTQVLRLPIEETSAKIRTGWPQDDDEDYDRPIWAGVIPITTQFGTPMADPDLRFDIPVPAEIMKYERPGGTA